MAVAYFEEQSIVCVKAPSTGCLHTVDARSVVNLLFFLKPFSLQESANYIQISLGRVVSLTLGLGDSWRRKSLLGMKVSAKRKVRKRKGMTPTGLYVEPTETPSSPLHP